MEVNENEDIYYDETVIMPPKKEWEVVCVKLEKYKELQAENKALKKERDAYKGMWEELKKGYSRDGVYFYHDCSDNNDEYVNDVIRELEKKYQQKHYPEAGNEFNKRR